jgi:hypothetical protein
MLPASSRFSSGASRVFDLFVTIVVRAPLDGAAA